MGVVYPTNPGQNVQTSPGNIQNQTYQQPPITQSDLMNAFNPGSFSPSSVQNSYGAMGPPGQWTAGAQPDTSYLQSFFDAYNAGVLEPANLYGQAQMNSLSDQMALASMNEQLQSQQAGQQAMFSMGGIGLQQQGLGVQQGALARQMALLPQQYGLQQQGFDISGQQLGLQAAQIGTSADTQRRQLEHQLVASGTAGTPEANAQRSDILQNRAFGLFGNQLQRNQLGLQRQGAALTFQEQQAQQQDAQKQLDISSKQLGLNADEVQARLQNALNQLGISSQVSVDQLLSEQYKIGQGMLSNLAPMISDIYANAGVPLTGGQ